MKKTVFGTLPDGREVYLYEISAGNLKAEILDYGAALQSLVFAGEDGRRTDVVLGYRNIEAYTDNPACMGCIVGPSANRIANGRFEIEGHTYQLAINDRTNNLHSDLNNGTHKRIWNVTGFADDGITMHLEMPDGDLGFPGNRIFEVRYDITNDGLNITYRFHSDAATLFNPTNHSYFNVSGHNSGTVDGQILQLNCHKFTPIAENILPEGTVEPVSEAFDFTSGALIGENRKMTDQQLERAGGFDHNFVIDGYDGTLRYFGSLESPETGIVMKCYTTMPGVQVYTGNFLGSTDGKDGAEYHSFDGVCLETQFFPNAINVEEFISPVAEANQWYRQQTRYEFSSRK
ncbi:MAG: galactose mutarotase [Erysipelotrichaceae bacterium]|nr:galactose mutarotase [Erysipelotrichaceae bacterium]